MSTRYMVVSPDDIKVGDKIRATEFYEHGTKITYEGTAASIQVESNGCRSVTLAGIAHQPRSDASLQAVKNNYVELAILTDAPPPIPSSPQSTSSLTSPFTSPQTPPHDEREELISCKELLDEFEKLDPRYVGMVKYVRSEYVLAIITRLQNKNKKKKDNT